MTVSVNTVVNSNVINQTSDGFISKSGNGGVSYSRIYDDGSVTKQYSVNATSGAGATTYDVTTLNDLFGTSQNFASVVGIQVYNSHATQTITIGGGSNPLFGTDQYTVGPGKCLYLDTSFTVSGSAKNLRVTPSATGTTYNLAIWGA